MFDSYKPTKAAVSQESHDQFGWLLTDFEPFEPDANYAYGKDRAKVTKDAWKIIEPKTAPPIGQLPQVIQKLINATWKNVTPQAQAPRNNPHGIFAATHRIDPKHRGNEVNQVRAHTFHLPARPTEPEIYTRFPSRTEIASDWQVFNQIQRINAVTFRGDTRSPADVIGKCGGFNPPNSRTDTYYLENGIYKMFSGYMKRRYNIDVSKPEFLGAVNRVATGLNDKKLLADYFAWRAITEREAAHLGRMVEFEGLKGYISTARAVDSSIFFGTNKMKCDGWLYATVVHGGFIVPPDKQGVFWGTEEGEIAQWGPIPAMRIVAFRHLDSDLYRPDGQIWVRKSFRKSEPAAFKKMFTIMSGRTPSDRETARAKAHNQKLVNAFYTPPTDD